MTISLCSWTAAEERAARGLAAADFGLTMKAAADSFPAGTMARYASYASLTRLAMSAGTASRIGGTLLAHGFNH